MKTYLKYINEAYEQRMIRLRPGIWITLPADVFITGKNIGKLDVKVSFKMKAEKIFNDKIIEFLRNEFKRKYKFITSDDALYDIITLHLNSISYSFFNPNLNKKKDINIKKTIDVKFGLMSFVEIEIIDDDDVLQFDFEINIPSEDIKRSIKKALGSDYNTIIVGKPTLTSKEIIADISVGFIKN